MAARTEKGAAMSKKNSKKHSKKLSKSTLSKKAAKKLSKKALRKQEKAVRKAATKLAKETLGSAKKPKKKAKQGKAAPEISAASLKLDLGTCPCCSKHCPLSKPKCGKGRAVARKKRERLMGKLVA